MKSFAGNVTYDPLNQRSITRNRSAGFCRISVDAFQAYVDRVGYKPERTPGGQLLFSPAFVRQAAEHFALKRR